MTRQKLRQVNRGQPLTRMRRGVIAVLASVVLTVLFAFIAFGVDTGRMVMTQTHMQNAADAASLAASQEIMAAIRDAGDEAESNVNLDINSLAVAQAKQVAQQVAAKNGVYIDPNEDVRFGKRVFNHSTQQWDLSWDEGPFNTVQVTVRRDNKDLNAPDAELRMAFGWAVGKASMPITVSAAAFIESRDMVLVMDFSSSMNDDSELRSINKLGQQAVEDNLELIFNELGPPECGDLDFEPQFLTLQSPPPSSETQAEVKVTFKRNEVFVESTKSLEEVKLRFSNGSTRTFSGLTDSEGTFSGSGSLSNKDVKSVWVQSGMVGAATYDPVTLEGSDPSHNSKPKIYVTFNGTSIYVESSKDLSNVVLEFSNGQRYKFDDLSGHTGTFEGVGSNEGLFITNAWIKSGTNHSGDGPGYGESFANPQEEGSYDLQVEEFRFDDTNANVIAAFNLNDVEYPYPYGSWNDVINYSRYDYDVRRAGYRNMYGALTWTNYLLDGRNRHTMTPDLWKTSHYPFHAVKNGASLFCEFLDNLDFGDELGLVAYDTNSRVETGLDMEEASVDLGDDLITWNFEAIDTIQRHKQAGHYGSTTGMGYAIEDGRILLVGDESANQAGYQREGSRLTMIVMTDGLANQYPDGWSLPEDFDWDEWTDYDGDGSADYSTGSVAKQYAFWQATLAIEEGITLHTMSVGANADKGLMDAIAFAGNGIHLNVPGGSTVAEMEDQMLAAFREIAANVPPPKLVFDKATQ